MSILFPENIAGQKCLLILKKDCDSWLNVKIWSTLVNLTKVLKNVNCLEIGWQGAQGAKITYE